MSVTDDNLRSKRVVVACLRDFGDGTSKLMFDDVLASSENNPMSWSFETFYTSRDYSNGDLEGLELTAQQYQEIGKNLVIPLLALNARIK